MLLYDDGFSNLAPLIQKLSPKALTQDEERVAMSDVLTSEGLDLIFRNARTHNAWLDKPWKTLC